MKQLSKKHVSNFLKSIWCFPAILIAILLIFTALNLNGSSIGVYHSFLYGNSKKDPDLIVGKPQTIRSDEWLVNTQMTIAQEKNGYKQINQNFAENKDMSLVIDAPYIDWSAAFKPQNFSFFILSFEHAFAFKWWLLIVTLLISAYFFFLKLLGKKTLAILVAIIIGFSPFVFWWYQTSTIAVLAYGFLILLVSMSLIDKTKWTVFSEKLTKTQSTILKTVILSYLLIAFGLILYPPFQIPVAIVVAFFMLGYLINTGERSWRKILVLLAPFGIAVVITAAACGAFLLTRASTVSAVANTVYPGKRVVATGGYDVKKLLVTYLQPNLQREGQGNMYIMNQSESANFIVLPLFLLVPAVAALAWLYVKKHRIEWILLSLVTCTVLFMADLFVPNIDLFTKLFALHLVPHERLLIGLGFLSVVLAGYLIKLGAKDIKFTRTMLLAVGGYTAAFFAVSVWAGFETSRLYPHFVSNKISIMLLAGFLSICLGFLIMNRPKLGLGLLALFSVASVIFIHPLYRGLGPIYNSEVTSTIQNLSTKDDVWAAAQHIYLENLPQMSGRKAVTGLAPYPTTSFWKRYSEEKGDAVYNRYAHTFLSTNNSSSLVLVGSDLFAISAGCKRKIAEKITYIVSTTELPESCNKLVKTVKYPAATFYFYKQ